MTQHILGGGGFDIESILPKLQSKSPEELQEIGRRMDADGVPPPPAQPQDNIPGVNVPPPALPPIEGVQGAVTAPQAVDGSAAPKSGWEQFLGDPQVLLQFGASLLQPRQQGTSQIGQIVGGLSGAVNTLASKKGARRDQDRKDVAQKSKLELQAAQLAKETALGTTATAKADRADEIINADIAAKNRVGAGAKAPTESDKLVKSIKTATGRDDGGIRSDLALAKSLQLSIAAEGKNFPLTKEGRIEQQKVMEEQQGRWKTVMDRLYPPALRPLESITEADLRTLAPGQKNNNKLKGFLDLYGEAGRTRLRQLGIQ